MQASAVDSKTLGYVIPQGEPEPPLFRSRYGGLWIDRRDAHDVLEVRRARDEVTDAEAEALAHYIDHGYVVFPKATDESIVDEYLDLFERAWDAPRNLIYVKWNRQVDSIDRKYYDEVVKVSDVHMCFERAGELLYPPPVLRFLTQIYERPPVVFQTMTMRKGTEAVLHIDTGPLTLTEPLSLAGSWVALEDIQPLSGEFQFIPGSHRLPELLHYGTDKAHNGHYKEHDDILETTLRMCEERGLKTETFMAKKGDVLIWHADLMHGGAPIQDQSRTRKSLVAHFMPLGVMPTFWNFAQVKEIPYPCGGYCTDKILRDTTPRQHHSDAPVASSPDPTPHIHHRLGPLDLWRTRVPLSVRKRVSPSLAAWARAHVPH